MLTHKTIRNAKGKDKPFPAVASNGDWRRLGWLSVDDSLTFRRTRRGRPGIGAVRLFASREQRDAIASAAPLDVALTIGNGN